jgi:hypothetical protein
MVGFDRIVGVLLDDVECRRNMLVEHPRVGGCPLGRDLRRSHAYGERPSEEGPGSRQIPPCRKHDVDDLAVLIDRPLQVGPPPGDLHVSFVDMPPVAGQAAAGAGCLDELGSEPLDPPVHRHVIDLNAAFGE